MANLFKKLKPILSLLLVIIVLFSLTYVFAPKTKQKSKIIYEENITKEIPADAVHPGELVEINYELSLPDEDDKIIDTNNGELAKKLNLKTFTDGTLKLIVGKSGKVKGFDNALVGLKVGETKDIIIPPSEPRTIYSINKTKEFSRNQFVARLQVFSRATFEKLFGKNHKVNDLVSNERFPWKYKVINTSNIAFGAQAVVSENQEFTLPGLEWKSRVLQVKEKDFMVRHNPKEGQIISSSLGNARINITVGKIILNYDLVKGQLVNYSRDAMGVRNAHLFKVTDIDDKKIVLQRDDNLAEKTLRLKVTLLNRSPVIYRAL